jgi:hypothetical protein
MAKSEHLLSTSTKKSQKQLTHALIVTVSSNQNQIQTFSSNFSPIFGVIQILRNHVGRGGSTFLIKIDYVSAFFMITLGGGGLNHKKVDYVISG